jgi:hypothetical protein
MKIAITEILQRHFRETGEYVTINMLAVEMTKKGIFKNIHSAQSMLYYNKNGKAKTLDTEILEFIQNRFARTVNGKKVKLTLDEIIK